MAVKYSYESCRDQIDQLMKTVKIKDSWKPALRQAAANIIRNRVRYEKLEAKTGIPWAFIGCLHHRESSCNFSTHLHNGDRLTHKTRRVPAGRPKTGSPPYSWEESALDALLMKNLDQIKRWTCTRIAYEAERYNGFGYRNRKAGNSPYVWNCTNHYTRGKFYADGKLDRNMVDKQVGVVALYLTIQEMLGAEVKDIKNVSRKLTLANRAKHIITWVGSTIGAAFSAGMFDTTKAYVDWLTNFFSNNAVAIFLVVAFLGWLAFRYIEKKTVEDYKEGRYTASGELKNPESGEDDGYTEQIDGPVLEPSNKASDGYTESSPAKNPNRKRNPGRNKKSNNPDAVGNVPAAEGSATG